MSKLSGTRVSAKTEAAATTYVAVIREAETVQVWYTDISTPVLHPRVHAYLAAKLLVHRAGVAGLGKFVCHGAAKDEPPAAARVSRLNLDKHADIKAAPNPPIPRLHMAAISITEPQVVPDKSRNRLLLSQSSRDSFSAAAKCVTWLMMSAFSSSAVSSLIDRP